MFQPFADNYVQPIAVFASSGPVRGKVLAQLVLKAAAVVEKAGAKIHAVITDGASTNRKFLEHVGVSSKRQCLKTYFEHPTMEGRKIFVFSDTPDLIKTIRNRLHDKKQLQVICLTFLFIYKFLLLE